MPVAARRLQHQCKAIAGGTTCETCQKPIEITDQPTPSNKGPSSRNTVRYLRSGWGHVGETAIVTVVVAIMFLGTLWRVIEGGYCLILAKILGSIAVLSILMRIGDKRPVKKPPKPTPAAKDAEQAPSQP